MSARHRDRTPENQHPPRVIAITSRDDGQYPFSVAQDLIIGQQRVIGLLTFFATPVALIAMPGNVFALFLGSTALGVSLLFLDRLRSVA